VTTDADRPWIRTDEHGVFQHVERELQGRIWPSTRLRDKEAVGKVLSPEKTGKGRVPVDLLLLIGDDFGEFFQPLGNAVEGP
jgi:hypothetical protein